MLMNYGFSLCIFERMLENCEDQRSIAPSATLNENAGHDLVS